MINAYHLSSATPLGIFGMFALWAAASPRHWFIRTAAVGGAILITLLIPAYEVVILLTIETAVVVVGLAIWRQRRRSRAGIGTSSIEPRGRLRISMETLMLAVVVVAVVMAVAARTPAIPLSEWYQSSISGLSSGLAALICVWLVFGRARWRRRLLAVPAIVVTLAFLVVCLHWAGLLLISWYRADGSFALRITDVLHAVRPNTLASSISIALGMAILCSWMYLMQRAGWFNPFGEKASATVPANLQRRQLVTARIGLFAFCCLAFIFPIALFYRLLTPMPIPHVKLPEPNGFDDFVAAARMINSSQAAKLNGWNNRTDAQLHALVAEHARVFDRVSEGLRKACWNPYGYIPRTSDEEAALMPLISAMFARVTLAERMGSAEEELDAAWDFMQLTMEADRGTGSDYSIPAQVQQHAIRSLWDCRRRLSARQCTQLAMDLWKLETGREPWKVKSQRQQIIEENMNWKSRLQAILADWSDTDRYEWARQMQLLRMTEVRILIADLAIRAHQLETNSLPASLAKLTPDYLPAVPDDPYGKGAIKYVVSGYEHALYSVGPDGDDDGGRALSNLIGVMNGQTGKDGDVTDTLLFPPAAANQSSAEEIQSTDTDAGRATRESSRDGQSEKSSARAKP
jgi:hypothetical protein